MASIEDTTNDEEVPLDFKDEQEEAEFLDRFTKLRETVASERRQSTMPSIGGAPLELYSFMKANPEGEDTGPKIAQLAARILRVVGGGVLGAAMRPLAGMNGFDWLFKVQFKSGEELEMFYDQLELQNDEGLIVDTLMVALPRLEGVLAKGHGEVVSMVSAKEGDDLGGLLDQVQKAAPDGLIKSSLRPIPGASSFFEGYMSGAPGFTHVAVLDFDSQESMDGFLKSGLGAAAIGEHAAGEPEPITFSYVFN